MGWLIVILLTLATGAALWKWGKLPRSAFEPVAAALLLGLAGYALQGKPEVPGKPVQPRAEAVQFDEKQAETRAQMGQRFGSGPNWLVAADGAMRAGVPQAAVTYIKSGLKENPRDPDLWVGLGNALIVHNGGMVSPAATYAFQRAADIAPEHPGPPFFMGLALAQSGQFPQARAIWSELLARTPADAPWRADLEERLAQLPS
ncbi:tetratricopeptide repeat protein [Sphingomonas sp.]|jgi:cytochrome c-type biogenesis protein CcmH/NrfG|uniref:tetratricopeptide repeat protein n=1 Tax=Sphingomonas sp. TaxID=28214 RepID=UPI002DE24E7E|nr:tetratricopeptide repeat protein [Sphingomonas sp.]